MASYLTLVKESYEVRAISFTNAAYETEIPALAFLRDLAKGGDYCSSAKGFKPLFERYASSLRRNLTAELFHEVDKAEKIWEFIKGDIRIFCFFDGNTAVLTHGALKKSPKVDPSEVAKAISYKKAYFGN
jgi:hypothetical protein